MGGVYLVGEAFFAFAYGDDEVGGFEVCDCAFAAFLCEGDLVVFECDLGFGDVVDHAPFEGENFDHFGGEVI